MEDGGVWIEGIGGWGLGVGRIGYGNEGWGDYSYGYRVQRQGRGGMTDREFGDWARGGTGGLGRNTRPSNVG